MISGSLSSWGFSLLGAVLLYLLVGAWLHLVWGTRSSYLHWPVVGLLAAYCAGCLLASIFVLGPYRYVRLLWLQSRRT